MFSRTRLAVAILLATPVAAVALPVVTVTAYAPAATASARPVTEAEMDRSYAGPQGHRTVDTTRGTARKVSGWGWILFGFASLGSLLVG